MGDTQGFKPSDLKKLPGLKDVTMLTYSFGPDADTRLPKQIACQNNGIWYHVKDKSEIGNTMAQYYALFAAGIDSNQVRWSQYTDTISGTGLTAGCLPAYDRSKNVPELVGVSCMDINVMISNEDLVQKPTFADMLKKMKEITSACPKVDFGASTLQHLRQQVGAGSVCRACDNTDEGCDDAPVPPSPPPSGAPSPTPGGSPSPNPPTPSGEASASGGRTCMSMYSAFLLLLLSNRV